MKDILAASLRSSLAVILSLLLLMQIAGCGGEEGNTPSAGVQQDADAEEEVQTEAGTADAEKKIPATDSASAATAMATGRKTEAGNISWAAGDSPNGVLRTISEYASDACGYSVGLISTVPFSHATPACFVAHNTSRDNYYTGFEGYTGMGISEEIVQITKPQLIIGSGHPRWNNREWNTAEGHISRSLYTSLAEGGTAYVFAERVSGVSGIASIQDSLEDLDPDTHRFFGLFGGQGSNFEPPVPSDDGSASVVPATEENPLLAEATVAALDFLTRDDEGFFLLVEQGDIDWANHNNNYEWLIGTMWDLEETVLAILDYVGEDPGMNWDNTLLIVTSDHSNSYMRLNPASPLGRGELPEMEGEDPDHFYAGSQVSFGCMEHTNELVSVSVKGPEQVMHHIESLAGTRPAPGCGLLDNTHLHDIMMSALNANEPVRNLILVIGDGMNLEHERAASIYLYGADNSLSWHDDEVFPFRGYCTTWDINTYDLYAAEAEKPCYSPAEYDPALGYDPSRGGRIPLCGDPLYFLLPL
ncbi:MAG: hypothetical protein GF388_08870 [Candidatus Aegiribacteria sp.]|nr:hypothetical protein [Candidatus Aegiribacteria sp.]